jgi:hypothetical protein
VGADRRGPLAAFVIVALIAAILLVTAVRSQAAPWFSARIVAGPAIEPHVWGSVTGGVDQVVHDGTVLVRKAVPTPGDDAAHVEAVGASNSVLTSPHHTSATTRQVSRAPRDHTTRHRDHHGNQPTNPPASQPDQPASNPAPGTPPGNPGHGRHLGWYQHHDQEQADDVSDASDTGDAGDAGDASGPPESDGSPEHGNGHANGHANGHGNGHANGHANGHGHAYGHDRH